MEEELLTIVSEMMGNMMGKVGLNRIESEYIYIYIHKIDMLYAIDMIGFIVRYMQCLKVSPGIQVLRADTWGDSH